MDQGLFLKRMDGEAGIRYVVGTVSLFTGHETVIQVFSSDKLEQALALVERKQRELNYKSLVLNGFGVLDGQRELPRQKSRSTNDDDAEMFQLHAGGDLGFGSSIPMRQRARV